MTAKLLTKDAINNNIVSRLEAAEANIEDILRALGTSVLAEGGTSSGGGSGEVKVSDDDLFPDYLSGKITSADSSITIAVLNDTLDEDLDITLPTPGTVTASSTNSSGSSHTHEVEADATVTTATAVLMETDNNGRTQIVGIGLGTAATADNFADIASTGGIGLSTSAGRLVFIDDTTDILRVLDADLHMNDGSNDTLRLRSSGDVGTQADILGLGDIGIAAQDDFWLYIDSNNDSSAGELHIAKNAETSGSASEILTLDETAKMAWRSGVAHGMTGLAETTVWAQLEENQADNGGALFRGLTDASNTAAALRLSGVQANSPDTTDTSSSFAAINLEGSKKSATTQQDMGSTENVIAFRNRFTTIGLFKGNGDLHVANTTLVALDDRDDVMLARAMQIALSGGAGIVPLPGDKEIVYNRQDLEAANMLRGEFINVQGTINALLGAVVQLGARVMELEAKQ